MNRIAIISDTHGNLPALQAVLADIRSRNISTIYCLGDLAGKGPSGAEVIDICRDVCAATVQGNWDAELGSDPDHPVHAWHHAQLGEERIAYLRALAPTIEFQLSGRLVRLFHASQISPFHRVRQYDPHEAHLAMFENTDFTGNTATPDIVGYGDIHVAYVKSFAQKSLFNAGSVGNPLDIVGACYAVLEGQLGSDVVAPWTVNVVRLTYDIEEAIRQARISGMPDLDAYTNELRTARYRGLRP